jgi:ABC-type branched-subunit amino acid transport system ATPase component
MSNEPLLDVSLLSVTFGGVRAVDDVSFAVGESELVGLIGPNGAGKTTCIDALSGFVPNAAGRVTFDGRDISNWPAHRRARAGIVRTFQSVELFEDLTLNENLVVAATDAKWWSPLADAVWPRRGWSDDIEWALEAVGLQGKGELFPTELAPGSSRLAALARALVRRPRLILLDEPAAGLNTYETEMLADRLRALPPLGVSVLLIDHDTSLVFGTCGTVHVLDFGRVISSGPPAAVRSDPAVIEAYLGTVTE